jgi:hypothetical protein
MHIRHGIYLYLYGINILCTSWLPEVWGALVGVVNRSLGQEGRHAIYAESAKYGAIRNSPGVSGARD